MISITVHHHNQQAAAATVMQSSQLPTNSGSSNVEVQYLTTHHHYSRPAGRLHQRSSSAAACPLAGARETPPLPKQRKAACRPSNNGEQRPATFDSGNNYNIAAARPLVEQHGSTNNTSRLEQQQTRLMNNITSAANNVGIGGEIKRNSNKNNIKLHSRSISLVINPEFSSDSETSSELAASLGRRRGLPRPTRRTRLLVDGAKSDQQQQQRAELDHLDLVAVEQSSSSSNCSSEEDLAAQPSCALQQQNPSSLSSSAAAALHPISSFKCCQEKNSLSRQQQQREPLQRAASAAPDNLAQFRQVGAMLRQISDEFVRSRRRTI